ncbi:MAG: hypothetical protein SwBeaMacB_23590 [Shewanella algae]
MEVIYLDQLHWIEISKYISGEPCNSSTSEVFKIMKKGVDSGSIVFPLSISHYFETLKHNDPESRKRLAGTMRELSKGLTILSLSQVVRAEIESALIDIFKLDRTIEMQYVGQGLAHALGKNINLNLEWPNPQAVPEADRVAFEKQVFDAIETVYLSGVLNDSVCDIFRSKDYTNDNIFMAHLNEWRGCAARMSDQELEYEIFRITLKDIYAPLLEVILSIGLHPDQISQLDEEKLRKIIDHMPTRKIDMHLRRQWAKNGDLKPKQSDLNDWAHLGSAICYADLVITEKQMANLLSRYKPYKMKVTSRLADLLEKEFA